MKTNNIRTFALVILMMTLSALGFNAKAEGHWSINAHDFQYDMTIYLDCDFVSGEADYNRYEFAAFVGSECRGVAQVMKAGADDVLYMRVRSNQENGEMVTFKYYDKDTGEETDIEGESIAFASNSRIGYPSSPHKITIRRFFDVNVTVDADGGGTVSVNPSNGHYPEGTEFTLRATAAEGHSFAGWSDGSTANPRTIILSENVNLTAAFTINSYTLSYLLDGEEYKAMTVEYGSPLAAIEASAKEGYSFDGWEGLPETMPASDVTVTGSYTINSYKLVFMIGDEVISDAIVEYNSPIVEPEAPEKEGHTFAGWEEHPATMPASDLTVNGSYTVNKYKLAYVIGEEVISESEVEYGTVLTAIETPAKEGYSFDGWEGLPETMPATDVTVTGSYTINSYKLTWIVDGETYKEETVEFASAIVEPSAPEKEGHTFAGWEEHPATMPASDLTVNGSYTVNKYKLTYTIDDEVISETEVEYGTALTAIEAPVKEGFSFDGWVGLPETMPANDVTVTGSYTINSYKLTWLVDGETYKDEIVEYASAIVEPSAPEKEGHTFAGWEEHPANMPASDLTVNGSYTVNKYKLTYIIDGEVISETEVEYGTALTAIEAPAKEGYSFDGWVGLPDTMPANDVTVTGSYTINSYKLTWLVDGETYKDETVEYASAIVEPSAPEKEGHTFAGWEEHPATMPASDLIVNGSYTVNKYKLAYTIGEEVISETEVEYGTALTAIEAPVKEGFSFDGWVGLPDTMPANDVTVTGSYTINSYKLTWLVDGETYKDETVEYASAIVEPSAPEKEGHTFAGWEEHPATMPASDLIVNGSYTVNKYKLAYTIGEEVISEIEVDYGATLTAIEAPAKEGYSFDGWVGLPETMPANDVTVTGSYTINSYKLVFKIGDEVISESTVEYNSPITEPEAPEKEGHTFAGWEEHPANMPASDLTINGSYTVNKYKLAYVIGEEVISETEVEYGTVLTAIEAPAKEGYSFDGWVGVPETMPATDVTVTGSYTINSYKLTWIVDGETYKEETVEYASAIVEPSAPEKEGHTFAGWEEHPANMPASDLTINGSYTVNKYKLAYVIGEEVISETEVEYGTVLTAIEAPAKEGYSFDGWVGLPDTMPANDVTVTGSYTINSYTISYYVDGELYYEQIVEYGTEIELIAEPQKDGYEFSGWSEAPETMPANDIRIDGTFTSGIASIIGDNSYDIYTIGGVLIGRNLSVTDFSTLSSGLYIINGHKVYIR